MKRLEFKAFLFFCFDFSYTVQIKEVISTVAGVQRALHICAKCWITSRKPISGSLGQRKGKRKKYFPALPFPVLSYLPLPCPTLAYKALPCPSMLWPSLHFVTMTAPPCTAVHRNNTLLGAQFISEPPRAMQGSLLEITLISWPG